MNASHDQSSGSSFMGDPSGNSIALYEDGAAYVAGASIATGVTFATGDTMGMAMDIGGGLIWWRNGAGNWNGSGTADPATGTGGVDFSGLSLGPIFIGAELEEVVTPAAFTLNPGPSYAHAAPSGFTGW